MSRPMHSRLDQAQLKARLVAKPELHQRPNALKFSRTTAVQKKKVFASFAQFNLRSLAFGEFSLRRGTLPATLPNKSTAQLNQPDTIIFRNFKVTLVSWFQN